MTGGKSSGDRKRPEGGAQGAAPGSGAPAFQPTGSAAGGPLGGAEKVDAALPGSTSPPARSVVADWVGEGGMMAEAWRAREIAKRRTEIMKLESATPTQVLGMFMNAHLAEEEIYEFRRERDTEKAKTLMALDVQLDWRREHDAERVAGGNKRGDQRRAESNTHLEIAIPIWRASERAKPELSVRARAEELHPDYVNACEEKGLKPFASSWLLNNVGSSKPR